jgi:DNA-binding CsgD family transcriptional regulator
VAHGTAALSAREIDLLRLLGRGYTYDEAALEMAVTLNTVRSYSRRIFQKLDVHRKRDALASARERGLLT